MIGKVELDDWLGGHPKHPKRSRREGHAILIRPLTTGDSNVFPRLRVQSNSASVPDPLPSDDDSLIVSEAALGEVGAADTD